MTLLTDRPGAAPRRADQPRLEVAGAPVPGSEEVLTPEALAFLGALHERFGGARHDLLVGRQQRREGITDGEDLRFLPETAHVRADPTWQVAGAGPGLEDRRVQLTGPVDAGTAAAAAASGAQVWLADLEDGFSPTWEAVVGAQRVLQDAARGLVQPPQGRAAPTVVVRPRGWHLTEKHLRWVDRAAHSRPASASLVDVGLHLFHNARRLVQGGRGPYFCLPKLEDRSEARLWNEVFVVAQELLGLPRGTVRASVLIETIPAAFQMEEILFELREHCAGLDAGRWDYFFSIVKTFRHRGPQFVLPDRSAISMSSPPMRAYTELLVDTCHRRGAHAIGGMSAVVPEELEGADRQLALAQVAADKRREARGGFDGTWVAHPGLVPVALAELDAVLAGRPHQVARPASGAAPAADATTAGRLLDVAALGGEVTDEGLRESTCTAVRYLEGWLRGSGSVVLDGLVEDTATAEIARSQVWQWVHSGVTTKEGTRITRERAEAVLAEVLAGLPRTPGDRFDEAAAAFREVALDEGFPTFATIPAYTRHLVEPAA